MLALQRTAGNRAVAALVAREPFYGLHEDEEREALALVNERMRLDDASVRAIQDAIGAPINGHFTSKDARALSRWRVNKGLPRGGKLTRPVLEVLVRDQIAAGKHNAMIHLVADASGLLKGGDILSLRFDPALTSPAAQDFSSADLRVIRLGPSAVKDVTSIQDAIRAMLATTRGPQMPLATPSVLTEDAAEAAAAENAVEISDRRAVLTIQQLLSAPMTGVFDATTSQFIAQAQQGRATGRKDGVIDQDFLHFVVESLVTTGAPGGRPPDHDALIRVVASYYRLPSEGLADVAVDPNLAFDFLGQGGVGGAPATLSFGPSTFGAFGGAGDAASIIHKIARGFEDVQLRHRGAGNAERAFLGAKLEVLSTGMAEEALGGTRVGFIADATEALMAFQALGVREQRRLWTDFERVRNTVLDRLVNGPASTRSLHQQLLDDYNAVPPP